MARKPNRTYFDYCTFRLDKKFQAALKDANKQKSLREALLILVDFIDKPIQEGLLENHNPHNPQWETYRTWEGYIPLYPAYSEIYTTRNCGKIIKLIRERLEFRVPVVLRKKGNIYIVKLVPQGFHSYMEIKKLEELK